MPDAQPTHEGSRSDKRLAEAQNICNTYLSFSLPTQLPVRDSNL